DSIGVFKIALDSRLKNIGNECVSCANAAPSGLVFISRTNPAQRCADLFVAKSFFTGVIESAVIGEYQVCPRANLHAFWRNFDALLDESIGFDKEGLRIDHHAIAEYTRPAATHDAGRQEMKHERLIANLYRVTGVVSTLVTNNDLKLLGEQIDDLAFSF